MTPALVSRVALIAGLDALAEAFVPLRQLLLLAGKRARQDSNLRPAD